MATVKPFKALRFNAEAAQAPISALVCPPYDVIDGPMQQALYEKSPYNVVRIEFNKQEASDAPGNDRYSRATATLNDWLQKGVLKQDAEPAFYIYEQTFDLAAGGASRNKTVTRRGLFGAIKLEPFGAGCVLPHEETFGAPKADRLKLMQSCSTQLSPVFGLIPDEDKAISALLKKGTQLAPPAAEATEENGVVNRLFVVTDKDWCAQVTAVLQSKNVYIADGHHRYETCCNYRDERRQADNDPEGKLDKDYNYGLMACVPMSDPGLFILPTHRLIQNAPGLSSETFLKEAAALFEISEAAEKDMFSISEETKGPVKFGVVFKDGSFKILKAKRSLNSAMKKAAAEKPEAWRKLDVSVLQTLVLKGLLQLSDEKVLRKEGLSYTPQTKQALARVTAPDSPYLMGFILRPTLLKQVVAMKGEKMPQKSTYFFPKLLTGMVIKKT
jgi:uncharacterized protein (DUF1015 family)